MNKSTYILTIMHVFSNAVTCNVLKNPFAEVVGGGIGGDGSGGGIASGAIYE